MGKFIKNQNGFSAIEALLILVIIVIIGGVGFFVWHSKNTTDKTLTTSTNTTTQSKPTVYFNIKEWGVRVPIKGGGDVADLYYTIIADPSGTGSDRSTAVIGSHALTAAAPSCDPTTSGGGEGAHYIRLTPAEHTYAVANPEDGDAATYYQVGNYYYGFVGGQAACYDQSNTKASAIDSSLPDIYSDFKDIQAIPGNNN